MFSFFGPTIWVFGVPTEVELSGNLLTDRAYRIVNAHCSTRAAMYSKYQIQCYISNTNGRLCRFNAFNMKNAQMFCTVRPKFDF